MIKIIHRPVEIDVDVDERNSSGGCDMGGNQRQREEDNGAPSNIGKNHGDGDGDLGVDEDNGGFIDRGGCSGAHRSLCLARVGLLDSTTRRLPKRRNG